MAQLIRQFVADSPRDVARSCYWTHCHACGQPLVYTADPSAKPQECKGHKH